MFWFWLGVILSFLVPPVGLVILGYYFFVVEKRDERNRREKKENAITNFQNILTSHPGPCPQCGAQDWSRGLLRLVPVGSFRMLEWPVIGTVSVVNFTCNKCGSWGRYGMCHQAAEYGWKHLGRWDGGW